MARNTLKMTTTGMEDLLTKLDGLGGDIVKVASDALEQSAETIGEDTTDAIADNNLPAGGAFSTGETDRQILKNPKPIYEGTKLTVNVGFDYGKPGAGGYLLRGRYGGCTGNVPAVAELQEIYERRKYMNDIKRDMRDVVLSEIEERMK